MNQRGCSLETESRRPSLSSWGEGSMDCRRLTEAAKPLRRGRQGQHGGKVMPSNWRNPPRPGEKSAEQGNRIAGNTGKSADGERDSAGSVVARKRSNVCGAKRPCCL